MVEQMVKAFEAIHSKKAPEEKGKSGADKPNEDPQKQSKTIATQTTTGLLEE